MILLGMYVLVQIPVDYCRGYSYHPYPKRNTLYRTTNWLPVAEVRLLSLLTDERRIAKWSRNEPDIDYSERLVFLYSYAFYGITILKCFQSFYSECQLTKYRVLTVKVGLWSISNEKLRTIRVRAGISHR